MTRHLGLDLGGSSIKGIVLERDGESYRQVCDRVVETRRAEPPEAIVAQLGEFGGELAREAGGIDTASRPIDTVGRPRPSAPFTKPASRKVAVTRRSRESNMGRH